MLIPVLIVVSFLFFRARPQRKNERNTFLDRDVTLSISGFFVAIIFLNHFWLYINMDTVNQFDMIGIAFTSEIGQLMVVSFLFNSGFGVVESFKKKGDSYANTLLKKRMPKIYFVFLNAFLLFAILSLALPIPFPTSHYFLSIFGFQDIGNDRWFIVVILLFYFISYCSFKFFGKFDRKGIVLFHFVFILIIYFFFKHIGLPFYWWNTLIAYFVGVVFSCYKEKVVNLFTKTKARPYIMLVISAVTFFLFFYLFPTLINSYNQTNPFYPFAVVSFVFLIVSLTSVVQIKNEILLFLGKHSLWIYLLHRSTFILFGSIPYIREQRYLYFVICLAATSLLIGYLLLVNKLRKKLLMNKKLAAEEKKIEVAN